MHFPPTLTEEEEILKQKYAKLRKKKKALQALKTAKPEKEQDKGNVTKRPAESAEHAKLKAKKLLKAGAIKIGTDSSEKKGFKRSKTWEKKLKDPEKTATPTVGFQPFCSTQPQEFENEKRVKPLHDSFISGGIDGPTKGLEPAKEERREREDRRRDREERGRDHTRRDREPPEKGNTIYVYGHGITEDILNKAFGKLGTVINISTEKERNCGFVSFERMETADQAIHEINGCMIDGVKMRVSMARHQPTFDQSQDPTSTSWGSIAASHSQKGGHKDKRQKVTYDNDDDIFGV